MGQTCCFFELQCRVFKTVHGHVMHPRQHVCNGLARPADESMLVRYNGTDDGT